MSEETAFPDANHGGAAAPAPAADPAVLAPADAETAPAGAGAGTPEDGADAAPAAEPGGKAPEAPSGAEAPAVDAGTPGAAAAPPGADGAPPADAGAAAAPSGAGGASADAAGPTAMEVEVEVEASEAEEEASEAEELGPSPPSPETPQDLYDRTAMEVEVEAPEVAEAEASEEEAPEAVELGPPSTPQDLYDRIEKSRDRLFFVAYEIPAKKATPRKKGRAARPAKKEPDHAWHLARVDLSTSLLESADCRDTGKYYVEFFTKASYDKGLLLPGHPPEDGVPRSEMQPRPDSASRYWLEWHEFHNKKNGDMVVGRAKELLPNSKKAVDRRLRDLAEREARAADPAAAGEDAAEDDRREGERKLASEYDPDFARHTTWADVMDLTDPRVRLAGPFDFADADPPPPTKEDLRACDDDATRALYRAHHKDLWVRDRVPLNAWEALRRAVDGRDVAPPTFAPEDAKKKGDKRGRGASGEPTTPAKKRALTNKGGRGKPFLRLPKRGGRPALVVRERGGAGEPAVLPKKQLQDEVRAVVERTLKGTRHAVGADRKIYYAVDEFRAALEGALGTWARGHGSEEGAEGAGAGAEAPQEERGGEAEAEAPQEEPAAEAEAETPPEEQAAEEEAPEEEQAAEAEAEAPQEEQGGEAEAEAEAPQEERAAEAEAPQEEQAAEAPQEEQVAGAEAEAPQEEQVAEAEAAELACDGEAPQGATALIAQV